MLDNTRATIRNDNTSVVNTYDRNNKETTFINQKLKDRQEENHKTSLLVQQRTQVKRTTE